MMTVEAAGMVDVKMRRRCSSSDHQYHHHKLINNNNKKKSRSKVMRLRRRSIRPNPNMDTMMINSNSNSCTTLQRLFDSCKQVFKGPGTVPTLPHVQNLCYILDCMKPEDVGLSRDLQFFKPKMSDQVEGGGALRVTSATIYKSPNFELCIFFIPASGVIPLHNHPEMTVFSKLLWGTMHIKAYDWVDPQHDPPNSKWRKAKLKVNTRFTAPCDTSVLYPTSGGNIHEFRAITPCAVLDVIGPPYSKDDGRECSYYREIPCHTLLQDDEEIRKVKEECYCCEWLEEIEIPSESEMDGIEYMGPKINNPNSLF